MKISTNYTLDPAGRWRIQSFRDTVMVRDAPFKGSITGLLVSIIRCQSRTDVKMRTVLRLLREACSGTSECDDLGLGANDAKKPRITDPGAYRWPWNDGWPYPVDESITPI